MRVRRLHDWDIAYGEARTLQTQLADRVQPSPLKGEPGLAAGLDCAFSRDKKRICAAVLVVRLNDFAVLETVEAVRDVTYPYIPGLLSFREAPVCIEAVEKLETTPDVFLVDGQGISHPRRLGLAAHLGLFFERPTIGCAKSRLTGEYQEPGPRKGDTADLVDKGEVIGRAVRTRDRVKPLFVSVGNQCTLEDAVRVTLRCTTRYRLPEPTRLAHQRVTAMRSRL